MISLEERSCRFLADFWHTVLEQQREMQAETASERQTLEKEPNAPLRDCIWASPVLPLSLDLGSLYQGSFQLGLELLDVEERGKVENFVKTLSMTLGASGHSSLTSAQTNELSRLGKILDRVDDVANFDGERRNAARLLQSCLQRLEWDEDTAGLLLMRPPRFILAAL